MVKILLCILWLVIIPFLLGKFLIKESENTILHTWILGHALQMGVFFCCAIPLIVFKESFTKLFYLYTVIIIAFSLFSLVINRKKFRVKINFKNFSIKKFLKNISIYQIVFIVLFCSLLFIRIRYSSVNDDDASFVSLSNAMIETDKMYLHDINGNEINQIVVRRALAPISAYYAVLSKQLCIHSTIVTHTIMPIILICIAYIIYYYFAKKIFKEKDSIFIFLIFLHLLSIYAFDVKGYNKYFILYTWFGRAILAAIILPFLWYISLYAMNKNENKIIDWITIFVLVNAGCLGTEMAVALIPISLGSLAIVNGIRDRKISYLLKSIICIIPCMIIGYMYLKIK